ncbi:uncharacterized protein TNCV_4565701 [Trichonephila clavipes]|nr:uncharacterized protein TNCV_4565701 [Trichonephila clavipes]
MVSDGTEFAVGDTEILFEEARKNTKVKHEKNGRNIIIEGSEILGLRQEVTVYKRSVLSSRSGEPLRKRSKAPVRQGDKRRLSHTSSANSSTRSRKRIQQAEAWIQERDEPRLYSKKNPRYRQQTRSQSRQEQEQELRSGRSSRQSPRRRSGFRQQKRQEMRGKSTSRRTASLEVLVGEIVAGKKIEAGLTRDFVTRMIVRVGRYLSHCSCKEIVEALSATSPNNKSILTDDEDNSVIIPLLKRSKCYNPPAIQAMAFILAIPG